MNTLRRQAVLVVVAVQFLTRLPVPRLIGFQPDWPVRAARFFPMAGQLVGCLVALVWLAAGRLWGGPVASVLAVGAGVLITGGFHEDGLADTADGLGGGSTRERRLAIMKDSRIGSFGALALVVCVVLRATALASLSPLGGALTLVVAHGAARGAAVVVMATTPYVGEVAGAKARPAGVLPTRAEAGFALVWGAAPLALLPWSQALSGAGLALAGALAVCLTAKRLVGGHTGDVLGAVEQVCEAALLIGAATRL